jgi:hypothetical protein
VDWSGRLSQQEIFMAAYLIAFAKVKNANRIPEYSSAAGPTLRASGGSVVTRGIARWRVQRRFLLDREIQRRCGETLKGE